MEVISNASGNHEAGLSPIRVVELVTPDLACKDPYVLGIKNGFMKDVEYVAASSVRISPGAFVEIGRESVFHDQNNTFSKIGIASLARTAGMLNGSSLRAGAYHIWSDMHGFCIQSHTSNRTVVEPVENTVGIQYEISKNGQLYLPDECMLGIGSKMRDHLRTHALFYLHAKIDENGLLIEPLVDESGKLIWKVDC